MSYKGRYILGDTVPLDVWCRSSAATPTEPDQAPVAIVCSDTAQVLVQRLPICDRYGITGYFHYPLRLDGRFAAGSYRVLYQYSIGGTAYGHAESFEVAAGGHADGPALALFYYRRPTSDFVVLQADSGRIIRRRNPRL